MVDNRNNPILRLRTGILKWYPFKNDASVLSVAEDDVVEEYLVQLGLKAERRTIRESAKESYLNEKKAAFDYVVVIGMLELCFEPEKMIERWKRLLKPHGHLLLGINNRLGIKYFCGEKEPFTGKLFNGVEGYRFVENSTPKCMGGKLYSKNEIENMLSNAGFFTKKVFSVWPSLEMTQFVFAEDYVPNEDLTVRIVPKYKNVDSIFLDEQHLYDDLVNNNLFHQMANAYFFDCADDTLQDILGATISEERSEDKAFVTIIHREKIVEKRALNPAGSKNLQTLHRNLCELEKRGIKTVGSKIHDGRLVMPYIEGELAVFYLRRLLETDQNKFIEEMDRFRNLILQSSVHVENDSDDIILERGFVDMVPINCFYVNGDFVFIDQEFVIENYPANAIIFRMVAFVYDQDQTREAILDESFFMDRYGITKDMDRWIRMSVEFTDGLKDSMDVQADLKRYETSKEVIQSNRGWMNAGYVDEEKLLDHCFAGLDMKEVYLFGTGRYAEKFWAFYHTHYRIVGVVDNDPNKWGTEYKGICIMPPRVLKTIDHAKSRVIICMRDYKDVYWQLYGMGITDIGLYRAHHIYPGRQVMFSEYGSGSKALSNDILTKKKYKIGYVAGVFDLFHIGHLNIFRRAKEQCDYLVVGVVSDEQVRRNKHKEPFVPFDERIEMVRACRYVDEANEIPIDYAGTVEAFQAYHFDVQFSGSDYINDAWWLEQKKYLEAHGAELVFFPYTESTSSSMLQSAIRTSVERN